MLDILKNEANIGDHIKLFLVSGKEPTGVIHEISETYIRVVSYEGKESRFFEKLIGGWEIEKTTDQKNEKQQIAISDPTKNSGTQVAPRTETSDQDEVPKIDRESKTSSEISESKPTLPGLKIVGKIDLDNIDRKNRSFQSKTAKTSSIRLIRAAKDLKLTMSQFVELAEELSIKVQPMSNFLISESDFKQIRSYNSNTSETAPTNQKGLKLNSLGDLKMLKEKIAFEEGKVFLPPNGVIKRYGRSGYGFITDNENRDYFFRFSYVEDKELLEKLTNSQKEIGTAVVCHFENYHGKLTATNIRQSEPIESLLNQAQRLYDSDDKRPSQDLLLLILDSFPDYSPARELLNKIKFDHSKAKKTKLNASTSYFRARTELSRGNFEEAKSYFEEALQLTDHRAENVVKELAYLYQREGNSERAIGLVKDNFKKFKSSDPNSFIAFFYETDKKYDLAIKHLEMVKSGSRNDNIKLTKRKATAYYRVGNYEKAEQLIKDVLKGQPEDRISQKILAGLIAAKSSETPLEELERIFNEAELAASSGGLSAYITFKLESCQYEGVPATVINKESFSKKTISELRKLIESIREGRPKERSTYLLTEAKLLGIIDPDNEQEKRNALAKYFTAVSQSAALEREITEVVRFYLLEAFKVSYSLDAISRHLPIYFYSFSRNSTDAYQAMSQELDSTLKECLSGQNDYVWFGLAELFLANSEIFSKILSRIYSSKEIREKSLGFLSRFGPISNDATIKSRTYKKYWGTAIENYKIKKQKIIGEFNAMKTSLTSEQFFETFQKIALDSSIPFSNTDQFRIKSIRELLDYVIDFNRQEAFEERERYFNLVQSRIKEYDSEIKNSPTEFSFEILRPLIEKLDILLTKEFNRLVEISSPELSIKIAGEGVANQSNQVTFQVIVSNKKGSAPVSRLELLIEDTNEFEFHKHDNISDQTLKGGEERPIKLSLHMLSELTYMSALAFTVVCKYKVRGSDDVKQFQKTLSLRFYSEKEFERINNPFATTADSGPVEDPSMFFGREEFLTNITESILGSGAKCIIIYGQKRSGKSSVLFHLKERLSNDLNAFCIQFSLGEIIEDLSSEVFYYKVLSEIEDSLDILRDDGYLVPEFVCPDLEVLSRAPAIVFNDRLKSLIKEMKSMEGWAEKKLVLLLDEFTYIYTAIKRGILSDQFMKSWKSFLEKGHFTSVLVGQDIMPKFTSAYPNEFGVTEPRRLSYLRKSDAKELIEKPVWDEKRNQSRFIGNALELILDYTSSNPYYIQIFCARIIEHMNRIKAIKATEADVEEVASSFITGADALTPDKFDNLITAGDAEVEPFPPEQVLMALKEIAMATKNLSSCSRDAIKNKEAVTDEILEDLQTREVLDCPQTGYYRINVRLFKEWLLKN